MKQITLKTLPKATAQQVFDQGALHLLKQGSRAMIGSTCVYKTENGLKCAGGCFISEKEYNQDFEDKRWDNLVEEYGITKKHSILIQRLQGIHDNRLIRPSNWYDELKSLAREKRLNIKAIAKFKKEQKCS